MTTSRTDDEYGPPTLEDEMWFHEHVRAAEYPKVRRGDKPMEGQTTIHEFVEAHWQEHQREVERMDADEQRAREDERDQFRDRPE